MAELLIEIGVEELPASFVHSGLESLEAAARTQLAHARLAPENLRALGTPRRLALRATVPAEQPDREETVTGPPWGVAFKDGEPSKAALGFAKKNGVDASDLQKVTTDKGDYVAAKVHEAGRPSLEILAELLPEICGKAHFRKSMRWGEGDFAYGRPIHWLVALLDGEVIPFSFGGVATGRESRGHRFLAPETFALEAADAYEERLARAHVVVDVEKRTQAMHAALDAAATKLGGVVVPDAHLSLECASMVEEPFVVPGSFDDAFLELPEEVVVSVMRDHQFYFAVRTEDGALMPRYLNVVNTAEAPDVIAKGNDRVLRARLADARFFVEEDRKKKLEERLPKLDTVTFQKKLGTLGDKRRRIEGLATELATTKPIALDVEDARAVARLCKADLESLIVFEFPELQGRMGRYYAKLEGVSDAVADAIAEHYQPAGADDEVAASKLGALVAVADRMDTLAGCFAIGQKPSSSADPFGLRRAALGVIRTALEGPIDVVLWHWTLPASLPFAHHLVPDENLPNLREFFEARLRAYYKASYGGDVVDGTLAAWDFGSIRDLDARMKAVAGFRDHEAFEDLAVAFKRAYNITRDNPPGEGDIDEALLEDGSERDLYDAYQKAEAAIAEHVEAKRYGEALALVGNLRDPIHRYFDIDTGVYVMVDDDTLRTNRLRLLKRISDRVTAIVHFHRLSL